MKFFLKIFSIKIIFLFIDFFSTNLFIKKLNLYYVYYPEVEHRISNEYYHHSFKKNIDTYDIWGGHKYRFITNSLGFKDSSNRNISKKNLKDKRIIINGDSFVEGIGYEYENTFVGKLDNSLKPFKIEILNAAVASQSPVLYYKKIKHLIDIEKIEFNSLIIFLVISDIPDEYYYSPLSPYTSSKQRMNELNDIVGKYLLQNFSSILFFNILTEKIDQKKRYYEKKYYASNEFDINFFSVTKKDIDLYKSIKVKRGNWTHDDFFWKKY